MADRFADRWRAALRRLRGMAPRRRHWWPLSGILVALLVHLLLRESGAATAAPALAAAAALAANLLIAASVGYAAFILLVGVLRRLLWRVRRKLILSYIFTGLLPMLLIGSLFLLGGTLSMLAFSAYMVTLGVDELVNEARGVAVAAAGELGAAATPRAALLARHERALAARGLEARVDLAVPPARAGGSPGSRDPAALPSWLEGRSFAGLAALRAGGEVQQFVVRAVEPVGGGTDGGSILVDLPMGDAAAARIARVSGATVRGVTIVRFGEDVPDGRFAAEPVAGAAGPGAGDFLSAEGLAWFTVLPHTDWESGRPQFLALNLRVSPEALYTRIFEVQARIGDFNIGYAYLLVFAAVALLFVVIEAGALVMGLALARSITGAVHELFVGTARVQQGDFAHRIRVGTQDQLGDLAASFNSMTASVQDLLQQVGEKQRLEEELRIARQVQMSLLPADTLAMPGLDAAGACVPAREVGGDYYDFIRLDERRLGILVADVSGKGTAAAFYMAELKGLLLSLSRTCESPRDLLIEVNRLMAGSIESGRFITLLYAVVDTAHGTLTCARAGHQPLVHVAAGGTAQVVAPDGLIAGLPGFEQHFEALIEEETRPLGAGDLVAVYTDGITEATTAGDEQFGEQRLLRILEQQHGAHSREVRDRVLDGVRSFAGAADQHDDMTIVVLRVGVAEDA